MSLAGRVAGVLNRSGILEALDRMLGAGGIVAYHAVTPEPLLTAIHLSLPAFRAQAEFLAARYRVIPLEEFVRRRVAGQSLRRCVALTFDDAYTGVRDLALPVLERLGLPATVFVASAYSASGKRYWWDRLGWIGLKAEASVARRLIAQLAGDPAADQHHILHAVVGQSRGRLTADFEAQLAAAEQVIDPVPLAALDEPGLAELARSPLIEFGCHTVSHPALPYLPVEEQARELRECTEWLEARLPRVRRFVAYPYGLYDRTTVEAMRAAGLAAGFSLAGRAATSHFHPFTCPRVGVAEANTTTSLRTHLSWAAIPLIALRNREWHPRLPGRGAGRGLSPEPDRT